MFGPSEIDRCRSTAQPRQYKFPLLLRLNFTRKTHLYAHRLIVDRLTTALHAHHQVQEQALADDPLPPFELKASGVYHILLAYIRDTGYRFHLPPASTEQPTYVCYRHRSARGMNEVLFGAWRGCECCARNGTRNMGCRSGRKRKCGGWGRKIRSARYSAARRRLHDFVPGTP
ncbi:hypothetical protein BC629DRAFT_599385 [Irpex lacteus]|nr:hypothetical protein BC629DRAFT_599385 [Irpex lacteus]